MPLDQDRDWVDDVMARTAWTPPDDFSERVVVRALASRPPDALPTTTPVSDFVGAMLAAITGFRESLRVRLEGSAWTLRQYRQVILR